ncbi:hypothetical protein SLA2020_440590 [Shorea laevis]
MKGDYQITFWERWVWAFCEEGLWVQTCAAERDLIRLFRTNCKDFQNLDPNSNSDRFGAREGKRCYLSRGRRGLVLFHDFQVEEEEDDGDDEKCRKWEN